MRRLDRLIQKNLGIVIPREDLPAYAEDLFIRFFAWVVEHEILHLVLDEEITGESLWALRKSGRIHHRAIRRLVGGSFTYWFWSGAEERGDYE